jgi:hypothetical protein
MATYKVMTWKGIPAQVKASDSSGSEASLQLPTFFQQEIDRVAMREGIIESDEYLDAWTWSEPQERDGDTDAVAEAVAAQLAEAWRAANA